MSGYINVAQESLMTTKTFYIIWENVESTTSNQ